MGANFTALFKNYERMNILHQKLNESYILNRKLYDYSNNTSHYKDSVKWETHSNDELRLQGVDIFSIFVGKNLSQLESSISWNLFISSDAIRSKCREICYELSKIWGTPIYLPDSFDSLSYVMEGKDINFIFNKLNGFTDYKIDHFEDFPVKFHSQ